MKRIFLSIIITIAPSIVSFAQDTPNPLKGDIRVHDPVMIKAGDTYYGMGIGILNQMIL